MKKNIAVTVLVVTLVLTLCASCAAYRGTAKAEDLPPLPDAAQSPQADSAAPFEKLLALRTDGWQDRSTAAFRDNILRAADTPEFGALFDALARSADREPEVFLSLNEDDSSFLLNVLMPLASGDWREKAFSGEAVSPDGTAVIEYTASFTITDPDALTAGNYLRTQQAIRSGFAEYLQSAPEPAVASVSADDASHVTLELGRTLSTPALDVWIECALRTRSSEGEDGTELREEVRLTPPATPEDYASLLALKTEDYADLSVAEFGRRLLDWANADYERAERVDTDVLYDDFAVPLSEDELRFVRETVQWSGIENAAQICSAGTGEPAADLFIPAGFDMKEGTAAGGQPIWCDFIFSYQYHISDRNTVTVEDRDRCLSGMLRDADAFWEETPLEDLLSMTESDVSARLADIARTHSTDGVVISIAAENVHFRHTAPEDLTGR